MQACTSLDVDIISLDLARKLPFKLAPSAVQAAVKRGIHFEVTLSSSAPMLLTDPKLWCIMLCLQPQAPLVMVHLSCQHSRSQRHASFLQHHSHAARHLLLTGNRSPSLQVLVAPSEV